MNSSLDLDEEDEEDTGNTVTVALIQFCATNNKQVSEAASIHSHFHSSIDQPSLTLYDLYEQTNWLTCERLIRQAVQENREVQLVCLPENFSFMGANRYESLAAAEPLFLSPTLAKYQALANELG
jgi:hypothetical protein